jgi:hypothetical protein
LLSSSAFFTYRQVQTSRRQLEIAQHGQVTERFTRAIDQLGATDEAGKPKIDVVLGGIYALERIARDSKDDHPQVVEVLTAYVREHTRDRDPPPAATTSGEQREGNEAATPDEPPRLATDVQAVMDVLARRDTSQDRKQHRLNLSDTGLTALRLYPAQGGYLERVNLRRAHLEGAQLSATKLKDAILTNAHLERAHLEWADLREVDLRRAHLQGAHLEGADLEGADLRGAHLGGAHLDGADLEGADLRWVLLVGADLSEAHLEGARLERALYDGDTEWPTPDFESEARSKGARDLFEEVYGDRPGPPTGWFSGGR